MKPLLCHDYIIIHSIFSRISIYTVKPTISSFTVHPPVARVGVSITLMCNATGYPDPVFQDFHLTKASPPWPETLPTLQKTNSGVTVTIKATLNHNGIFICSVHNAIGQAVEDALVTVYGMLEQTILALHQSLK